MDTALDGSQASPTAQNGASSHALAPIATLEGGGAVVAELARAFEHDLSTPGPRASDGPRLHPRLGRHFATFCGRHGLEALPASPQTLAWLACGVRAVAL